MDKWLLSAFLAGYGWGFLGDLTRRAMVAYLPRQFDVLGQVAAVTPFDDTATPDAFAELLWVGI